MELEPVTKKEAYEIMSHDAIAELHQKFMDDINKKAQAALPEGFKNPDLLLKNLQNLLITAARKSVVLSSKELLEIASAGKDAIKNRIEEIQKIVHTQSPKSVFNSAAFSKKKEKEFLKAASRRKDDQEVINLFDKEDRVYLTLNEDMFVSETQKKISEHLLESGYHIVDYNKGYATDEKGKQQLKIGKLLRREQKRLKKKETLSTKEHLLLKEEDTLYKSFVEDSTRTLSSLLIVVSRNASDIAHMSTGRAWVSCMGAGQKNSRFIPAEIEQGSLIAYLVSKKDPEILNPLSRILIKPLHKQTYEPGEKQTLLKLIAENVFKRKQEKIFIPSKIYGIYHKAFIKTIDRFIEDKLNKGKEGTFVLKEGLYSDGIIGYQERGKNWAANNLNVF